MSFFSTLKTALSLKEKLAATGVLEPPRVSWRVFYL